MLTGHHAETAAAIAREVGLGDGRAVVVSAESEPEKFELEWLKTHADFLHGVDVVARCHPLQKLRIVQACFFFVTRGEGSRVRRSLTDVRGPYHFYRCGVERSRSISPKVARSLQI